jgi:2-keto-3-deoxy-L-rhamnonate aldolase RhmA
MTQRLKLQLDIQSPLLGLIQTQPNLTVTELAGACGYGFVMFDCEHGLFTDADLIDGFRVLAAFDTLGLVRTANQDPAPIGRYLDFGADVLLAPNVCTLDQAKTLAKALRYPPAGLRGVGGLLHRSTHYGRKGLDAATDASAALLVMIESEEGARNAAEILSVDGVDGAIIGPFDLSADLGCLGKFDDQRFLDAVSRIERSVSSAGKILGTSVYPGTTVEGLYDRGHRLLLVGADVVLIQTAMTAQVQEVQRRLSGVLKNGS